jgi:1,4-dihydroxy-2-naphthoyl-CoA synthase
MPDYEDIAYEIDEVVAMEGAQAFAEKRLADFGQFVTA